ncbi:MAG TPA: DUF559 domain-containing protein [Solirubrobacteraceae bacterium]|nr:DUF559 domain-containing protein [Solirubrobacteraceae bacterium]
MCAATPDYQRLDDTHAALAALALRQHAVFRPDHLEAIGISRSAAAQRVAAGRLFRVYHAVYSFVPANLLSIEGRYLAAVFACGPSAVLSHRSGAALHGLRPSRQARIEVTVVGSGTRCHPGIQVHRSRTLDSARDVVEVRGIPVTSVARTLLDLAEVITPRGVTRALDQAEILRCLDVVAIRDQLKRNHGRHGAPVLAELIQCHHGADTLTASELEERVLALIRRANLPAPEVNAMIALPEGEPIYGDFVWRAQRLIVETDGRASHGTAQAFEGDRTRDQRALLGGWRVVRFTWRQVVEDPARVAATIAALLSPAG